MLTETKEKIASTAALGVLGALSGGLVAGGGWSALVGMVCISGLMWVLGRTSLPQWQEPRVRVVTRCQGCGIEFEQTNMPARAGAKCHVRAGATTHHGCPKALKADGFAMDVSVEVTDWERFDGQV